MKRYIEIVYDNSGSMESPLGNKLKYEIAQELFEKEILPTIGYEGDEVVLRLLRKDCFDQNGPRESLTAAYGNDRMAMLARIKSISHDQFTPLFNTIYDSIEACKKEIADQYLIFVLTDGDDTCKVRLEDIVSRDTLNKYVHYYNVLLVQLAVESQISRNNLTALASYLGGQSIILDSHDSIMTMMSKMKKALKISGFSQELPLEHCFESLPGFDMTWVEVAKYGIDFNQALLLYFKSYLSWKPEFSKNVSSIEFAELKFLFGIVVKSGLPDQLVSTMLSHLKKPYYYSHQCIYWDFSIARWKYFTPQNLIDQIDNPDAIFEDGKSIYLESDHTSGKLENYQPDLVYSVEVANTDNPKFNLIPVDGAICNVNLKIGDKVKFNFY
jgi:hypothetical protein